MSVEDLDLPPGSQIAGRYVIERGVRRGAHLAVYTAHADASAVRYTVRVARLPSPGGDAEASVARELQRVAMLRQRAVSGLVGVVREGDDLAVITERADGPTLRELLQKGGHLKSADICRLITEVAAVLDAMHSAVPPLVHRALMPENIAVGERMLRVWVDECGLAQALTQAGVLPVYASTATMPYRSRGELAGRATPADDVFVLASLAYECITGRPAHEGGSDEETAALILRGPRPSVRALRASGSTEVDAVLQRAWSDEASYATAGAFTRELVRVLTANPSSRGIPAATAKARPESVELRGAGDPRQATLLGVVPGSHGDSAASGNPMKSTLLGIGGPRSTGRGARAGGPFGPPLPPAVPAGEGAEPQGDKSRGRRLSETTQRVEVPRIRPPGTEPVDAAPSRARATTPFGGRPFPRPVGAEVVRPASSVPPPPPSMYPQAPSVAPMLPEPVEPNALARARAPRAEHPARRAPQRQQLGRHRGLPRRVLRRRLRGAHEPPCAHGLDRPRGSHRAPGPDHVAARLDRRAAPRGHGPRAGAPRADVALGAVDLDRAGAPLDRGPAARADAARRPSRAPLAAPHRGLRGGHHRRLRHRIRR
jgi:serine/threonine protein kinase